ncbi:MAG: NAD(+)/NADH kinase [Desulfosudaceae bacterium]
MKIIGMVVKSDPEAEESAAVLEEWFVKRGVAVVRQSPGLDEEADVPEDFGCLFVLGGDGTFLSAARWIGDLAIPMIGIKFGEVGFLAETVADDMLKSARRVIDNDFTIEQRMRLAVTIYKNGAAAVHQNVLNDVVINKGALARLAHIRTMIDHNYLTTYHGDGLIVSTPTGSTAYSLAAGGPIIHPLMSAIVLTPICPFTLTNRPLVVPDQAWVTLQLDRNPHDIVVTLDGQKGYEIDENDTVVIARADCPIHMIRLPGRSYFDVLKAKLKWSGGGGSDQA